MKTVLFFLWLLFPLLSWGGCDELNLIAERYQDLTPASESVYKVVDTNRVYFYSAPNEECKIKNLFIIKGDLINLYAEYKGFSSVVFFKENGGPVSGWIHSKSILPTGKGDGPE